MNIPQAEFNAMSISDILVKLSKIDDLEMHLKSAYELIDEQNGEIKDLGEDLKMMEERAYKAENRVEELEVRFSGFTD